jgi:hypothetical protein
MDSLSRSRRSTAAIYAVGRGEHVGEPAVLTVPAGQLSDEEKDLQAFVDAVAWIQRWFPR